MLLVNINNTYLPLVVSLLSNISICMITFLLKEHYIINNKIDILNDDFILMTIKG
ncbi:Uncharacterised protein [Yersinia aleksiciae]|nr:Uncharacterised protein [Yersinia aleksiciae]